MEETKMIGKAYITLALMLGYTEEEMQEQPWIKYPPTQEEWISKKAETISPLFPKGGNSLGFSNYNPR
jgi:hypothetical protein